MSLKGKHGLVRLDLAAAATPPPTMDSYMDDEHRLDSKGTLRLGADHKIEVEADELLEKCLLGRGQFGSVYEMYHRDTDTTLAVKRIRLTDDSQDRHRLWMDHDTAMRSMDCPHTILFYGSLFREGDVWICMERMNTSLDNLYRAMDGKAMRTPESVLGRVTYSVVMALDYLAGPLRIIHRDVKPSNMLLNVQGQIKLCDFGISGRLVNSVAKTKEVGCKPYMAPERIKYNPQQDDQDGTYDVRSDVWSLGISLVEIATATFPFSSAGNNLFKLLGLVVEGPVPALPKDGGFSLEFQDFTMHCLKKDPVERPKYKRLMEHSFFSRHEKSDFSVAEWYADVRDRIA